MAIQFYKLVQRKDMRKGAANGAKPFYAIANTPYISELNGDNRELYRRNIIALEEEIGRIIDHIIHH